MDDAKQGGLVVDVTDEQLREWRELCDKATPGPWEGYGNTVNGERANVCQISEPEQDYIKHEPMEIDSGRFDDGMSNRAFIAAARTAVPALLAEVERLRLENAEMSLKLAARQFITSQNVALLAEVERLNAENKRLLNSLAHHADAH